MTREQQDDLLDAVRISKHEAVALDLYLEAMRLRYERPRMVRPPEPEPEDVEEPWYV